MQRVTSASVTVDAETVGSVDAGLLVLLGVARGDRPEQAETLARRVLRYRVFADEQGRMNRSLLDIEGQLLVVSQFTLTADTRSGLRPGFSSAAEPALAQRLYEDFVAAAGALLGPERVACGRFGADMKVALVNDGPVTFLLET